MSGFLVFIGGGLGALLRFGVSLAVPAPFGTWVANLVGSFLLAALMHPAMGLDARWHLALGTGMMGGFTTYSTFNLDVLTALHEGESLRAFSIVVMTLVGCLLASALGWNAAGWWAAR